ncbi:uncharacterized protein LOC131949786 [Physella acuta]|uniref:uncharacterized protein LOC131949786 n=1 Tax=Physella acuta TaxID=109671 RepID=UPI0027DDE54C|nr:uncharacterized protein LOC131949786 [Physella acuta]XP_059167717.1 uncharacterized protein LOC131949786 [Physella acuta]
MLDKPALVLLLGLHSCFIHQATSDKEEVYFNHFGHCSRPTPYDLNDEDYLLLPKGGEFIYENSNCEMTFKAPSKYGICLKFQELQISTCDVKIKIFTSPHTSGAPWYVLKCHDTKPNHLCTPERFITVQVHKTKLNKNEGYTFKIEVEKSSSISEEGVLIASIGVFVGVILGVVAFIAIIGFSILYCCCKWTKSKKKKGQSSQPQTLESGPLVEPSAPPAEQSGPSNHLYPKLLQYQNYPSQDFPPPYAVPDAPPPPYTSIDQSTETRQQH